MRGGDKTSSIRASFICFQLYTEQRHIVTSGYV